MKNALNKMVIAIAYILIAAMSFKLAFDIMVLINAIVKG